MQGLLVATLAVAAAQELSLHVENLGPTNLGVFWNGDLSIDRELTSRDHAYERLVDVIKPKFHNTHTAYIGHSFIFRTADLEHRVKARPGPCLPFSSLASADRTSSPSFKSCTRSRALYAMRGETLTAFLNGTAGRLKQDN